MRFLRTFFYNFIAVFIIMTIIASWGIGFLLPIYLVSIYNEWHALWGFLTLPSAIGYTVAIWDFLKKF